MECMTVNRFTLRPLVLKKEPFAVDKSLKNKVDKFVTNSMSGALRGLTQLKAIVEFKTMKEELRYKVCKYLTFNKTNFSV